MPVLSRKLASKYLSALACVLLALVFARAAWAQQIDPLVLGDSLYEAGGYDDAATEYQRYLFFNGTDEMQARVYSRLGLCFSNLGDWDHSVEALRTAVRFSPSDSLRSLYKIATAIVYISSGNHSTAEIMLLKLSNFSTDEHIRTKASFFLAVNYIYQHKWKEVRQYMGGGVSAFPAEDSLVSLLLDKAAETKYKSPRKARLLSTLLPGLGQIYAGKPLSAFNAIALNAVTSYYLYSRITAHADLIEMISAVSLFARYWSGNRNRAAEDALSDRARKDARLQQEILAALDRLLQEPDSAER